MLLFISSKYSLGHDDLGHVMAFTFLIGSEMHI